jgi:hypothetical protein
MVKNLARIGSDWSKLLGFSSRIPNPIHLRISNQLWISQNWSKRLVSPWHSYIPPFFPQNKNTQTLSSIVEHHQIFEISDSFTPNQIPLRNQKKRSRSMFPPSQIMTPLELIFGFLRNPRRARLPRSFRVVVLLRESLLGYENHLQVYHFWFGSSFMG